MIEQNKQPPSKALDADPDISITALRDAIPKECWERSTAKSMRYIMVDFMMEAVLVAAVLKATSSLNNTYLAAVTWVMYGFVQGLVVTGLWIVAHECGHGALSPSPWVNDVVGWVVHSHLFVPYFSWKYTHARHHRYTNHMDRDVAMVPMREEQFKAARGLPHGLDMHELTEDAPIVAFLHLLGHQLLAFPLYWTVNITAGEKSITRPQKFKKWWSQNHFDPNSVVFTPGEATGVLLSDLGLILTAAGLYLLGTQVGWWTTFLLWGQPYLWVNHWLVAIVFLQHQHPDVAHYDDSEWTFVKGALSTVDRDFGIIGRQLFHGAIDFHVVHHLFPKIPFYHAERATEAIKPLLGSQYREERGDGALAYLGQLWSIFRSCQWVKPVVLEEEVEVEEKQEVQEGETAPKAKRMTRVQRTQGTLYYVDKRGEFVRDR